MWKVDVRRAKTTIFKTKYFSTRSRDFFCRAVGQFGSYSHRVMFHAENYSSNQGCEL